jgi:hypothetical protein
MFIILKLESDRLKIKIFKYFITYMLKKFSDEDLGFKILIIA